MKKIFVLILICLLNVSMCSAKKIINSEQAAIGGISTGADTNYIKSIYGEPNEIFTRENNSVTWFYGTTFQIEFVNDVAISVVSSGPNGLTTPNGISVGMKKNKIRSQFGSPNQTEKYKNRAIYFYEIDNGSKLIFIVKDKIISEIRVVK